MSEKENPMQKIITKCWQDEAFKQKLIADPVAILKAEGVPVPEGVSVTVVESTERQWALVIPPAPKKLTGEQLDQAMPSGQGCGGFVLIGCEIPYIPGPVSPPTKPPRMPKPDLHRPR